MAETGVSATLSVDEGSIGSFLVASYSQIVKRGLERSGRRYSNNDGLHVFTVAEPSFRGEAEALGF